MSKILLVEDNEMNRDMLSRRLERKEFEVVIAVDGQRRSASHARFVLSCESRMRCAPTLAVGVLDDPAGWLIHSGAGCLYKTSHPQK